MDYKDGRSELLTANETGSLEIVAHDAGGALTCTAWYPQGHRFSDAEMKAALIDVSAKLDLDGPRAENSSCAPSPTREAHARVHHRTAQNGEAVVARIPE
jgi:hypothetical protein